MSLFEGISYILIPTLGISATAHLANIPTLGIIHSHEGNVSFPSMKYQQHTIKSAVYVSRRNSRCGNFAAGNFARNFLNYKKEIKYLVMSANTITFVG